MVPVRLEAVTVLEALEVLAEVALAAAALEEVGDSLIIKNILAFHKCFFVGRFFFYKYSINLLISIISSFSYSIPSSVFINSRLSMYNLLLKVS